MKQKCSGKVFINRKNLHERKLTKLFSKRIFIRGKWILEEVSVNEKEVFEVSINREMFPGDIL